MLYFSYGKQCTPCIYNVFTIPDSADLDILTFIKSLHWFNELTGLSYIFLTVLPNMYCISISTHCVKQAMPSLQIHMCLYCILLSSAVAQL